MPRGRRAVAMRVELSRSGGLHVTVGERSIEVSSRTSEPEGRWIETTGGDWQLTGQYGRAEARWAGTGYEVTRVVEVREDHVHVEDTLRNTTESLVGVIYENRLHVGDPPEEMLLGGHPVFAESQEAWVSCHPSAFARWRDLAAGLLAEDDIYRVHALGFRRGDVIGVSDPQLGLPPGGSHTLEWSVYPVLNGDYWDVVNAVRRNWGSNITLPGPVTFDHTPDGKRTAEEYGEWARRRGLQMVFSGQTVLPNGDVAEGTGIPLAEEWCAGAAEWTRKLHETAPDVRALIYLHSQICTEPDARTLYADSRLLDPDGRQVTSPYRYPVYLYLTTLDDAYGKALLPSAKQTLQDLGADGFYLDEIEYASAQYADGAPWDNCTVTIDSQTHAVTGTRSSVTLLQQPWKQALTDYLRANGMAAWGNGEPTTRTMLSLKVPRFVEMSSYSFLVEGHLATPLGLGNHDNVGGDRGRAEMARRMLDHAGLLVPYEWTEEPQGLHFLQVMYPTTPLELHAGMVLGEERIVTNRSGCYGWSDGSAAEVYVFDAEGRHVPEPRVREATKDGLRLAELRMPSNHFAVLVRVRGTRNGGSTSREMRGSECMRAMPAAPSGPVMSSSMGMT